MVSGGEGNLARRRAGKPAAIGEKSGEEVVKCFAEITDLARGDVILLFVSGRVFTSAAREKLPLGGCYPITYGPSSPQYTNRTHATPPLSVSVFRFQFPRLRFTTRSNLFWSRNARLVSSVVSAVAEENRAECIHILLNRTADQKRGVAHEDKRSFDCTAAEVGAGIMAVLVGQSTWSDRGRALRQLVLPYVEREVEGVSLEGRLDWWESAG